MSFTLTNISQWYRGQTLEKKVSTVLLAGVVLSLVGYAIYGQVERLLLKQKGVYYAARIYQISSGKSGPHYYIEYSYKQKTYKDGFLPSFNYKPNREGAYIFIKLLPENPSVYQYLDEGEVTDSLLRAMPKEGWKTLPDAPRQYLLDSNYIWYQ